MRRILMLAIVLMATVPVLASAQEATALKTDKDKLSYAMGMDLAGQLKAASVDVDPSVFAKGMQDLLAGKTLLTDAEAKAIISELQKAMVAKQAAMTKASGDKNKAEGEKFLADNKTKEGVVTLPSGLQYKVLEAGEGQRQREQEAVAVALHRQ